MYNNFCMKILKVLAEYQLSQPLKNLPGNINNQKLHVHLIYIINMVSYGLISHQKNKRNMT